MNTPRSNPLADLAETVGAALLVFAERVRSQGMAPSPASEAPPAAAHDAGVSPDRERLGVTQQRILAALDGSGSEGLTTAQVADQVGIKTTNAPRALKALRERGLIVGGDEKPAVWRAAGA